MKKFTIFTLIGLLAIGLVVSAETSYTVAKGDSNFVSELGPALAVAGSLEAFISTAFDAEGNVQNDEGHVRAVEAMMANFDRRFRKVLEVDISTMSAEEQMAFFSTFGDLLSTMGRINSFATAYNTSGYLEVPLLEDYSTLVDTARVAWTADKVDNELVKVPTWGDTFEAQVNYYMTWTNQHGSGSLDDPNDKTR